MNTKRNKDYIKSIAIKKKRRVISLQDKLHMINKYEAGITKAKIAREYGLNESTVRHIIEHADNYKQLGQSASSSSGCQTTRNRTPLMIEMETLLSVWIEDCNQKRIPLNQMTIKTKALSLFETLKRKHLERKNSVSVVDETFSASSGWLDRFKKRSGILSIRLHGEMASVDERAATSFPYKLQQIIEEGKYTDDQIFNADVTGLLWKKMPTDKTQPGYKVSKERVTLLLCGNASGNCKMKPLFIYRSQNPRSLRSFDKNFLPVHWRSNRKSWMTKTIFEDWFKNCFCPETERYCKSLNLDFKILLILDNAHNHPTILNDLCKNVKIIYLPPNTSSIIQPMDQGVIASFKAYYLRRTFSQAIENTTTDEGISLTQFWKAFNIKNCIENVKEAWNDVKSSNLKAAWRKIIPNRTNDCNECDNEVDCVINEITKIGLNLGLTKIEKDDVQDLLESDDKDLISDIQIDDKDLISDIQIDDKDLISDIQIDDNDNERIDMAPKEFTIKEMDEMFRIVEILKEKILNGDPNLERSMKVRHEIENAVRCYRVLYEETKTEKSHQTTLDPLLIKKE